MFFKGCNLKCKWCHNPEGIKGSKELLVYKDRCKGCNACFEICKNKQKECTLCAECTIYCPQDARELCGKEYTPEQVLAEIERDIAYYESTQGGVTLSGGECMLQIDFVRELLRLCHERDIRTAVDTAGNVPYEYFEEILPYTSTILFDLKCVSYDLHQKGTGVGNDLIIANLKRLSREHSNRLVIRVPIIGGFNDSEDELAKITDLLSTLRYKGVEVLPYHNMAQHKYQALNMDYKEFYVPDKEKINELGELWKKK